MRIEPTTPFVAPHKEHAMSQENRWQHSPSDEAPLPPVEQGEIDPAMLASVLDDIARETKITEVRCKGAPDSYVSNEKLEFASARRRFEDGEVRAMQVRYEWRGREWTDTFLRSGTVVRLVRVGTPGDSYERVSGSGTGSGGSVRTSPAPVGRR